MALYTQTSEPGTPAAGDIWINTTTGDFQTRNTAKSDWNLIFNINEANGGLLPLSGGTMTGAIEGAHGLLAADSPGMTGTPTIEGDEVATKDWVTETLGGYQEKG